MSLNYRKKGLKLFVAGNATLDAEINGSVSVQGSKIVATSGKFTREIKVEDGPIRRGHKHRYDGDIEAKIRGLMSQLGPGGGGVNLITAISQFADIRYQPELVYVDVSKPDHPTDSLIKEHLDEYGVLYEFFGLRDVPINALFSWRGDKIIVKGKPLDRSIQLTEKHQATIDRLVEGSKTVTINGAKDTRFVEFILEAAQKRNIPVYFGITPSLEPDFVFKRLFPYGDSVISDEDLVTIFGEKPTKLDDVQLMERAVEYTRRIKAERLNNGHILMVTCGSNGALCTVDGRRISQVSLKDVYALRVSHSASNRLGGSTGAGDNFTAKFVYEMSLRRGKVDIIQIAVLASEASIRYLGYRGPLPYDAFHVRKIG